MKKPSYILWSPPEALGGDRPLPVKVRNKDFEVVAEGLTGQHIPIPAGSYWVTATLLNGREVGPAKRIKAMAEPPATAESTDLMADLSTGLEAVMATGAEPPESISAGGLSIAMADAPPMPIDAHMPTLAWSGDWWSIWDHAVPSLTARPDKDLSVLTSRRILPDPHVDQMLAMESGDASVNYFAVVPFDLCLSCVGGDEVPAILAYLEHGQAGPSVRFRSDICEKANTLLTFIEAGMVKDMQSLSSGVIGTEDALIQSGASMLRAIAAGYVMLRSNAIDGLDVWLDEYADKGDLIPDIWALRAETFARLGQHDKAADALENMISGRCPWFRSGLSYAFDRLRLYIAVSDNKDRPFSLADGRKEKFDTAYQRLDRALGYMDVSRIIATFALPA